MKPLGSRFRKRSNTLRRNDHKLSGGVTRSCRFTAAPAEVTGTLMFRERIILRPGTVVEVSVLDTSRADSPATELARQVIEDLEPSPLPFVLEYASGR
jgi:uncharacterized lipoprotein YbaY